MYLLFIVLARYWDESLPALHWNVFSLVIQHLNVTQRLECFMSPMSPAVIKQHVPPLTLFPFVRLTCLLPRVPSVPVGAGDEEAAADLHVTFDYSCYFASYLCLFDIGVSI